MDIKQKTIRFNEVSLGVKTFTYNGSIWRYHEGFLLPNADIFDNVLK